jgi:hypothetical protein
VQIFYGFASPGAIVPHSRYNRKVEHAVCKYSVLKSERLRYYPGALFSRFFALAALLAWKNTKTSGVSLAELPAAAPFQNYNNRA